LTYVVYADAITTRILQAQQQPAPGRALLVPRLVGRPAEDGTVVPSAKVSESTRALVIRFGTSSSGKPPAAVHISRRAFPQPDYADNAFIRRSKELHMLANHIASFLKFINSTLEDISRGIASPHHLHNVRCGIENILSLLAYNKEVIEKADQLSRRACDYITYHDLATSKPGDRTTGEDVDRLRAVREALAGFRSAVEQSQPNSRARTLGLA
jgi:hypothetical protein